MTRPVPNPARKRLTVCNELQAVIGSWSQSVLDNGMLRSPQDLKIQLSMRRLSTMVVSLTELDNFSPKSPVSKRLGMPIAPIKKGPWLTSIHLYPQSWTPSAQGLSPSQVLTQPQIDPRTFLWSNSCGQAASWCGRSGCTCPVWHMLLHHTHKLIFMCIYIYSKHIYNYTYYVIYVFVLIV